MDSSATFVGLATLAVVAYFIRKITAISLSQQEPPLLKPRVPFIGHILGIMKYQSAYSSVLQPRTNKSVVTLPMLNRKTYFIFSPYLIQQAMRHRNLDFDQISLPFSEKVAAISDHAMAERVRKGPNTFTTESFAAIKSSLTGQGLYRLNVAMLAYVASQFNGIGSDGLQLPSMWLWMREMMGMATVEAFYGHANPFRADPTGLEALWDFDDAIPTMLFAPPSLARAGARYRDRVVRTLRPFFDARQDQNDDVSAFVSARTEVSAKYNVMGDDVCKGEVVNIWAGTTNSIPMLFWTFTNVWLRPNLVEKLRDEVYPLVTFSTDNGKRKATLDMRSIEEQCPLLVSCQRESVRVANHMLAQRAITADTLLTDEDGATYLFKQGSYVMWSAKVAHEMPDVWGADALDFNPERFMQKTEKTTEKKRRAAYMPFGGGTHLCPGRNFAATEILGFISAFLLGYEVEGFRGDKIKIGHRALATATPKPAEDWDGGPVTVRRREGWVDVEWAFSC